MNQKRNLRDIGFRTAPLKEILNLPESVIPLSIIPIGYPDEQRKPEDRFNKERIHYDRW